MVTVRLDLSRYNYYEIAKMIKDGLITKQEAKESGRIDGMFDNRLRDGGLEEIEVYDLNG